MAQEIEVKVKVVTDQAVSNVDALGNAFDNTAKDALDAQKAFNKAGSGVDVEQSLMGLRQLKRELKNTAVGTEEFKRLYNAVDDLEDKLKSAKNTSQDWVDSLEGAGGSLGVLGGAINKVKVATQTWGGALKATGVGLIVALIASLTGAFSENEGAMKKLQPLLNGMQKIFQGVFRAVEPLFNTLVDLAINALPMVSKSFEVVYSSVTAVLQSLGSLGSAMIKLMSGDFKGAWSSAKESVSGFSKHYDNAVSSFKKGSQEMTKNEIDEAEKRKELAEKQADERQKSQDKQDALDKKEEERRLKKAEDERKSYENSRDELEKHEKAIADLNNKYDVEKENRLADTAVKKEELDYDRQVSEIEKITTNETEKQNLIEKLDAEHKARLDLAQVTDNEKKLADAKIISEANIKIAEAEAQQKKDIQEAQFALASGAVNFLKEIAGKNKAIQIASIIAENAVGIGKMLIANNTANIGALATPQAILTSGASAVPVIAMNNITTALGVATTIASTAKALSALGGGGVGSAPKQAGNISAPASIPVNPNIVSDSSSNQLANSLSATPIKAYVVSKDMTSQQSLDRNITDTASIG